MRFFEIFWTIWKVRSAINIQQKIENTFVNKKNQNDVKTNIPQILNELHENNIHFDSFLNKHRKLVNIQKELVILPTRVELTTEEREKIKIELLRAQEVLNNT